MAVVVAFAACVAAYVLVPLLLVLPHELGHAIAARIGGARRVDVEVGAEPRRIHLGLGRFSVRMRLLSRPSWLWYGTFRCDLDDAPRWMAAAVSAAGPLTTGVLTTCYAVLGGATEGFGRWFFWFLAVGGAWTFLVTAAPIRYGRFFGPYAGRVSDGYRIREALSRRRRS